MTDSPYGTHRSDPRRRRDGSHSPSRPSVPALHAPASARNDPHRPTSYSAFIDSRGGTRTRDFSPTTLTSITLALIVVAVIASMSFFHAPDRPELPPPMGGEAILGSPNVGEPEEPPVVTYSPAPVSLSTRASPPTRSPSHRPQTSSHPTSPNPSPSPTMPRPPAPRADELTPLSPSEERNLRSYGGGPETFVDFLNARHESVVVHWLDYDGRRRQYRILQAGQGYRQQTYVGHPWVVTNSRGTALVCFLPAYETKRAAIR